MGRGLIVDLDPRELNALSLAVVGKLGDVLTGSGAIEDHDNTRGWRRIQLIRYSCGSDAYARLVRIVVLVDNVPRWTITPKGSVDELALDGLVGEGSRLTLRLQRDPATDPAALPSPFPDVDVRAEVFG